MTVDGRKSSGPIEPIMIGKRPGVTRDGRRPCKAAVHAPSRSPRAPDDERTPSTQHSQRQRATTTGTGRTVRESARRRCYHWARIRDDLWFSTRVVITAALSGFITPVPVIGGRRSPSTDPATIESPDNGARDVESFSERPAVVFFTRRPNESRRFFDSAVNATFRGRNGCRRARKSNSIGDLTRFARNKRTNDRCANTCLNDHDIRLNIFETISLFPRTPLIKFFF